MKFAAARQPESQSVADLQAHPVVNALFTPPRRFAAET
jgi:hypothetical protein